MPGAVLNAKDDDPVLRHLLASGRYRQTNESIIRRQVTLSALAFLSGWTFELNTEWKKERKEFQAWGPKNAKALRWEPV